MKFNYLEVLAPREANPTRQSWLVRCECGKEFTIGRTHLLGTPQRKPTKSCGCRRKAQNGEVAKNIRLYSIWHQMKRRCHEKKNDNYDRYGGKGITVCDEWRYDFLTFLDWSLKNGYTEKLTIDRIDSTKPYEPDNCRWVTLYEQAQNKGKLKNNRTGVSGVTYNPKNKYRAYITRNGTRKQLGSFQTLEEAAAVRKAAEEHFAKHGTIENL